MRFAIPRETGYGTDIVEHRVALSPAGVRELCHAGAEIIVQSGAGQGAGFLDEEYRAAGAQVVYAAQEVYRRADVLLRVERPREEEWLWLAEGATVIGFLHLHTIPPSLVSSLLQRRLTLVGLEAVRTDDGSFPLQKVSSQIAGRLAPQLAAHLLTVPGEGMGVLLSGLPGIPPADVVILGAGTLGGEATRAFLGIGASVYVLDSDLQQLERLDHLCAGRAVTALATRRNIEKFASFAEVLVGAVRTSSGAPLLVTRQMVRQMKRGAVILDFAINEGGCVETSRPTPLNGTFVQDGVVHYAPPNVPSLVPRTATYALTQALLPYLHLILQEGVPQAVQQHTPLARGVYMLDGRLTQLYTGEESGRPTTER